MSSRSLVTKFRSLTSSRYRPKAECTRRLVTSGQDGPLCTLLEHCCANRCSSDTRRGSFDAASLSPTSYRNDRTTLRCSGSTPYPDMTAREVMRNVHNGYRLERPSHCRSELFRVIARCWHADPDRRPEFQAVRRELAQLLEDNMNGHYVDLESFASECTD